MQGPLIALVALQSAILIAVVIGAAVYVRRLNVMAGEVEESLRAVREAVVPLAEETRLLVRRLDSAAEKVNSGIDRTARIAEQVERLLEIKGVVDILGKAALSSKVSVIPVLIGVREALKALGGAKKGSQKV